MSRTATATPPPPYFPPRNATPTMRHSSAPNVSAAHFANRLGHHPAGKRRTKNLPLSLGGLTSSSAKKAATGLSRSFERSSSSDDNQVEPLDGRIPILRSQSSALSVATSSSTESFRTSRSESSIPSPTEESGDGRDEDMGRSTPTPSMSASLSTLFDTTPLPTPESSRAPSLLQQEGIVSTSSLGLLINGQGSPEFIAPVLNAPTPARPSWVPNFGKMAKAVVHTGMSMGMSFSEKRAKKDAAVSSPRQVESTFAPNQSVSKHSIEELRQLPADEALARSREWAEAEQRRVTECARLCSQWPHSGYNLAKCGPSGAKHFYEPQSYSNPQHVASLMQRQAELERLLCTTSTTFFSCRRSRSSSNADTERSVESYESSLPSPNTLVSNSSDDALAKTAADIQAAMASSLLPLRGDGSVQGSQVSLRLDDSPKSVKGTRSLTELSSLASSMALSKVETSMDVDQCDSVCACGSARDRDIKSCGAKRPLCGESEEEDKRRKVDEAMVVEEAVDTGVIMPNITCGQNPKFSASTPDLSQGQSDSPAVFGHVVKTSDTHPIIISPFFPAELLPILSAHLVMSPSAGPFSTSPLLMSSAIDVPSVLLSFAPPAPNPALVPNPVQSIVRQQQIAQQWGQIRNVGNLLLSSCPGKRLRMGGSVKGRGPVCRDLCTDLRRIKNEGVGCLVCCLDDTELELLGVPWETYLDVAASTGLDVLRLPMPDGFTPVSLSLFDAQINLIATKYSLHGTDVLVHCRGGVGRAGLTACAWAIKMGFVPPHPSLAIVEQAALRQGPEIPVELEHQIVMSIVERVIAMIRSRRGLKAIESFEQVQFLASYVRWLRTAAPRAFAHTALAASWRRNTD